MKTLVKSSALVIVALFISVVSTAAQEAISESYFLAALEAIERSNYSEAARFARLGLSEIAKLRATNPKVAQGQSIRGLNLLSGALIELKNYPKAEKVKLEEIVLLEYERKRGLPRIFYQLSDVSRESGLCIDRRK